MIFSYGLFTYTVSSSGYTESKSMITVNNEFDWTWKKMAVAQFGVLPLHLSGRTEENHNKNKS